MDEHTRDAIKLIRMDIAEIKRDVKRLIGFRMMLFGGSAVVSFIVAMIVEYCRK